MRPELKKLRVPIVGIGSHSLAPAELDVLDLLGVKHVRHTRYAYQTLRPDQEAEIKDAIARGFKLLMVVHGVEHMDAAEWQMWISREAARFPGVEAWQIGNEHPFHGGMPTHCIFHRLGQHAIKDESDALVVSMDLSHHGYRETFKRLNPPTDAWAVHCYEYPNAPQIERLSRQLIRPLWITEMGITESQIPSDHAAAFGWETVQATEWREGLEAAGPAGYSRAYFYQLRTDEITEKHGLLRPDRTLRPAAEVLRAAVL